MTVHSLKANPTLALFYENKLECITTIHSVLSFPEGNYIFCNESPFHPQDYLNGNQPGDIGYIKIDDYKFDIVDSHTFISDSLTGQIVRPSSKSLLEQGVNSGHYFLHTGHFILDSENINSEMLAAIAPNKQCFLSVDKNHRSLISRLHTASHIIDLAFNQIFSSVLTHESEAKYDLRNTNFAFNFFLSSRIYSDTLVNTYFNKTALGEPDFESKIFDSIDDDLSKKIEDIANQIIQDNLTSEIRTKGDSIVLGSKRTCSITIYNNEILITCGGVHIRTLEELKKVTVSAAYDKIKAGLIIQIKLSD